MKFSQFQPSESHVLLRVLEAEQKTTSDMSCPFMPKGFAIGRHVDHEGDRGVFVFLERAAVPFPLRFDRSPEPGRTGDGDFVIVPRSAVVGSYAFVESPRLLAAESK